MVQILYWPEGKEPSRATRGMDPDSPRAQLTAPQQMASSCAGAALVALVVTPLDVVKIRLQTQDLVRLTTMFHI